MFSLFCTDHPLLLLNTTHRAAPNHSTSSLSAINWKPSLTKSRKWCIKLGLLNVTTGGLVSYLAAENEQRHLFCSSSLKGPFGSRKVAEVLIVIKACWMRCLDMEGLPNVRRERERAAGVHWSHICFSYVLKDFSGHCSWILLLDNQTHTLNTSSLSLSLFLYPSLIYPCTYILPTKGDIWLLSQGEVRKKKKESQTNIFFG